MLREIGDHPEAFAAIEVAVVKAARELLVKRLKHKSLTVQDARDVRDAVGPEMFYLVVEGLSAANLKSIAAKLDRHHPEMKGSTPHWQRQHLRALVGGTAEPVQKSGKPKKAAPGAKAAEAAPTPIGFKTEAMSVFRDSLKRK
ncbi:MAG: hypothetical protein ACREDY_16060 [Bradyrhizobium sp.]